MEIKISKKELLQGLACTQGVVEKKSTMPILANVCIKADTKTLTLTATDLEVGVIVEQPADVIQKGSVTISARAIFDIVKELPDDRVHLNVLPNHWVEISSGKAQFKIMGLSAAEFPKLPGAPKDGAFSVDVGAFHEMIAKTSYAMSTDETRYTLNGVFLEKVADSMRLVATDGHRMSYADRPVTGKWSLDKGVIIPRKGILEWKRLLDGADGDFTMSVDTKHIMVQKGNATLMIRLIDGQYPPYNQVIPKEQKWVVAVDRTLFMQALRRVQLVTTDRARGVRFRISPKHLELIAKNPDVGEAHEELQVKYQGETFEIGFNGRYFSDVLNIIDDEEVVLELKGEMGPCVIRSEFDRSFLAVIMPMRL